MPARFAFDVQPKAMLAPFSYGTIYPIAVMAKSTVAYPVGRLFSLIFPLAFFRGGVYNILKN